MIIKFLAFSTAFFVSIKHYKNRAYGIGRDEIKVFTGLLLKFVIPIIPIFLTLLIIFGIQRNDCYYFHVQECKDCHERNLGFAVCSGFCGNSTNIDNPCYVDLSEKCEDNIAHGCNLPENEYITGWCIPFTELCW